MRASLRRERLGFNIEQRPSILRFKIEAGTDTDWTMIKSSFIARAVLSSGILVAFTFAGSAQNARNPIARRSAGEDYTLHTWKKLQLTKEFWSEGANYGDFNHDGKMDVVAGPYWWEGPGFQKRHEYHPATKTFTITKADGSKEKAPGFEGALGKNNAYSDNFFAFTYDFNKDGWDDILIYGFPGEDASWYENPGGQSNEKDAPWARHMVLKVVDNESPTFADIDGDGRPDIVCNNGGFLGYATADWKEPAKPWTFHKVTA